MGKKSSGGDSATAAVLFGIEETISRELLALVPDHAEKFVVPIKPSTVRLILKPRGKNDNYFGAEIFVEARAGLDLKAQTCTVSRRWLKKLYGYIGPGTRNKGGSQIDMTKIWPVFRHYWYKVDQEDKAAGK